tara:strand:+ start:2081 stop:2314 length:234 start_codon:yes stop_codon:yes gene_type:complete
MDVEQYERVIDALDARVERLDSEIESLRAQLRAVKAGEEEARSLLAWIAALPAHTEEDYIESFAAVRLRLNEGKNPV